MGRGRARHRLSGRDSSSARPSTTLIQRRMGPLEIGGFGILALFALMLLQVPIGFAMIIVGVVGFALQSGWATGGHAAGQRAGRHPLQRRSRHRAAVPADGHVRQRRRVLDRHLQRWPRPASATAAAAWPTRRSAAAPRSASCAARPPRRRRRSRRRRCPKCSSAATRRRSRPARSPRAARSNR